MPLSEGEKESAQSIHFVLVIDAKYVYIIYIYIYYISEILCWNLYTCMFNSCNSVVFVHESTSILFDCELNA